MTTKICSRCYQEKPLSEFYITRRVDLSRDSHCKVCRKQQQKEYWGKEKATRKNIVLKYIYGITLEEYNALLAKQNGVCALCGNINRHGVALHVDHDHTTGEIRGLLCFCCNSALGNAHDNPVILRKMADYLEGK